MAIGRNKTRSLLNLRFLASPSGVVAVLTILAILTRLLPLSISTWPYNNDGLTESRVAEDMLKSGRLEYPFGSIDHGAHSLVTPAYNVLLAFGSAVIGSTPFDIAQFVVAALSILTVVGGYVIALRISASRTGALSAAMVLALLGTFVFLTGSTWKSSIGISLMILLSLAYMNRSDRRMLVLEVVILVLLPLVHHLVAVISYFAIAYLTIWSVAFGFKNKNLSRRHLLDVVVIAVPSAGAYVYYRLASLDRLSLVDSAIGFGEIVLVCALVIALAEYMLAKKTHFKMTFAPIPAVLAFGFVVYDHFHPIFPYTPISPWFVVILVASMSLLICVAWFGFEVLLETNSRYRAIPLGLFLPVMTICAFAVVSGLKLSNLQIVYRTFDFMDIGLALGIAVTVAHLARRRRATNIVAVCLICALLLSFPFGYFTGPLLGVRHDVQQYEVDALNWTYSSAGVTRVLNSDERLSYTASALYDYEKWPELPYKLAHNQLPTPYVFNIMEDEWTRTGVNAFPYGHPILNVTLVSLVLDHSNVIYVGGPQHDKITIFYMTNEE